MDQNSERLPFNMASLEGEVVLEADQITALRNCTPHEIETMLAKIFHLEDYETSLRTGAILDYYVASFCFCAENKFTDEELSRFFIIQMRLLENCAAGVSLLENINVFRALLSNSNGNEQLNNDQSVAVFRSHLVKIIIDYVTSTLFTHHNLYRCVFFEQQSAHAHEQNLFVNLAPDAATPFPPPLEEAISLEWYELHMCPRPETAEDAADEAVQSSGQLDAESPETDSIGTAGITEQTAEQILATLKVDDIRAIIQATTSDVLHTVKAEMEQTIGKKRAAVLKGMPKV